MPWDMLDHSAFVRCKVRLMKTSIKRKKEVNAVVRIRSDRFRIKLRKNMRWFLKLRLKHVIKLMILSKCEKE